MRGQKGEKSWENVKMTRASLTKYEIRYVGLQIFRTENLV